MVSMERRMEIAQLADSAVGLVTANGDATADQLRGMDDAALLAAFARRGPAFERNLSPGERIVLIEEARRLLAPTG